MRGTNFEVAKAWLQGRHAEGKNGNGNLWFADRTLYSYATPIATKQGDTVLYTSYGYSPTTKRYHLSALRKALIHVGGFKDFSVPFVLANGGRSPYYSSIEEAHAANFAHLRKRVTDEVERLGRKRLPIEEYSKDYLRRLVQDCEDYAQTFGITSLRPQFEDCWYAATHRWEARHRK